MTTSEHSEVIGSMALNIRVCSALSEEKALAWLRGANPAGTAGNWQSYDHECNPEMAPVACQDIKGRNHFMFEC